MSSCLATTLRSSETLPSVDGMSCAMAAPAARSGARTKKGLGESRRVPARLRLIIEFLVLRGRRDARRLVRRKKAISSPRRRAGAEEEVGGMGGADGFG